MHETKMKVILSSKITVTLKHKGTRRKLFQVLFAKDGSVFVNFPYFRHRIGLLAAATIPGDGKAETQVDLKIGGKVASHLVKYSHHPDGRAHFSQDGKIYTAIKRESIPLNQQAIGSSLYCIDSRTRVIRPG